MTTLIASVILATAPIQADRAIPTFSLKASDGLTYSQRSLVKKPTVVVFLSHSCPHTAKAAPDLNRLKGMFGKNVALVAITDGNEKTAKSLASANKFKFPVLGDESGKTIEKFGARHSLDFVLIDARSKKVVNFWEGYSRTIVGEILNEIGNNGGPRIKADLSAFSESRMSGCGF